MKISTDRIREAQHVLAALEQHDATDEGPLIGVCVQMMKHMAQGQLSAVERMCAHARDGWVPIHFVKEATHGQRQDLCEQILDFECNDVVVAGEQDQEYAPLVAQLRELCQVVRDECEKTMSNCDFVLAELAYRTTEGYSGLHLYAFEGNNEKVLFYLRAGNDADVSTDDGFTPLMAAARKGHDVVVKYLIDFGADTNIHMRYTKKTALHLACEAERLNEAVVDRLLRSGADERTTNWYGQSPLDALMSTSSGKEGFETVRLLLKKASAKRRWGWLVILRNRASAEVVGGESSGDVGPRVRHRRSSRLSEGRAMGAVEFLTLRAPDGVFGKVISFL